MTSSIEIPAYNALLSFDGSPVLTLTFKDGGVPYFSLDDLCKALGWHRHASVVDAPSFPPHGKRIAEEVTEDGIRVVTVLSPVGVWFWTHLSDPYRGQRLAAWAKREALRLCADAPADDPAMYLQLMEDGSLPPCPKRYSGRRAEREALKWSPAYLATRGLRVVPMDALIVEAA